MTSYKEKIDFLVDYLSEAECEESRKKLGMEIEHFLVKNPSLRALTFHERNGVEALLELLAEGGWKAKEEKGSVVGLEGEGARVNLEPGGQFELTILPQDSIQEVETIYLDFVKEVTSILDRQGSGLLCLGYQPETPVEDIPLLPKQRYKYMYDYFGPKGKYAYNMMKGTAAIHVSLDYFHEQDYSKKNLVANTLAPLVYTALDNSPFFEGTVYEGEGLRWSIWQNCDPQRSGHPESLFRSQFGYVEYAEYLLNVAPMVYKKDGELVYSGSKLLKDILLEEFNPTRSELEYLLTTVFPDVRTKDHLEIRVGDSLPYPYSMAYLSLWKGLLYDSDNLDRLFDKYKGVTSQEFSEYKRDLRRGGVKNVFHSRGSFLGFKDLVELAHRGLEREEKGYLDPLKTLARAETTPKEKTLENIGQGKAEALAWCNLNEVLD